MYLVFDIETTGLVACEKFNKFPDVTNMSKYDNSRIVQIAWVVLNNSFQIIEKKTHIVKRDNFSIKNFKFHGITDEISDISGIRFEIVMLDFLEALKKTTMLIAHNILFDYSVLSNHLIRYNLSHIYNQFTQKTQFCTSYESTHVLKLPMLYKCSFYKYPSLQELYFFYFKKKITNAHDALADTLACAECFTKLVTDTAYAECGTKLVTDA